MPARLGMVVADLDRRQARAGTLGAGPTTLTATVTLDGVTVTDEVPMRVLPEPARPFRHDYHQTLTMKMFLADRTGTVSLTFGQALDAMRRVDNLTRGATPRSASTSTCSTPQPPHRSGSPMWTPT